LDSRNPKLGVDSAVGFAAGAGIAVAQVSLAVLVVVFAAGVADLVV